MAGPIEILIVTGVFGLIGAYMYIVSRFIRDDTATPEAARREQRPDAPRPVAARHLAKAPAH